MNSNLELIFIRQIIMNLMILPIPAMLIVQVLHRKKRPAEMNFFFRMCIFNMALCLTYIATCFLLINYHRIDKPLVSVLDFICDFLIGVIPLLLVVYWLLFVEYTLHHSMDIIWRRYPVVMIPFYAGLVITFLTSVIPIPDSAPMAIQMAEYYMNKASFLIWCFYIIASYIVLEHEKKRKKIPEYIRVTPTVIPIVLGLIISATTSYLVDGLGYAVGLMFADYHMFRRLSYMDPDTGFFNERYLEVLKQEAESKDIKEAMVIRFRTLGDREKLAKILKNWQPEFSKIVVMDDGEFRIFSELKKKAVAERFIYLVSDHCKSRGIETEASYEMIRMEKAGGDVQRQDKGNKDRK